MAVQVATLKSPVRCRSVNTTLLSSWDPFEIKIVYHRSKKHLLQNISEIDEKQSLFLVGKNNIYQIA